MTATPIASPRARALGAALRAARESRGIGLRELSRIECISHAMLSLWEKGTRVPKVKEVAAILGCLSIVGAERDRILELAEHAHEPDWLEKVMPNAPLSLTSYIECERTATGIATWHPLLIPGLLQSGDYARAVIAAKRRSREEVDKRLLVRMARKEVLGSLTSYRATIGEAALRASIGGPTVMIDQLDHLLTVAERANVSLRVMPLGMDYHQGLCGPFSILDFANLRPIVFSENLGSNVYLYDEEQVAEYRKAAKDITNLALSEQDSCSLIRDVIADLEV
ncbi:helix-turn-helix domain-containing protein [Amycolatopsis sp. CA-230715]|uniref:helix-turn-helix domain-containing protein n=1 Tax=Amycolatopsis sp. CA-230715 TaxID=2745196 RepID=UPI001C00DF41|nr:helix-turn-helix transcriptional regulator [Amycolatopsis sp. CA-230715]QWF79795.1 hypothetical protein HUW46_03208 [Amycolatopsis sp. CA-230715]